MRAFAHHPRRVDRAVQAVLVTASLGLLAASVLFDVAGLATRRSFWALVALQDQEAGLVAAAVAGALALRHVADTTPESNRRRTALLRITVHTAGLILLAAALLLRTGSAGAARGPFPSTTGLALAAAGLGLQALAGWLAAELARSAGDLR